MEIDDFKNNLYTDVCKLIEEAKDFVAHTANKAITILYWKIGERINNDLLEGKRAEYGKQIVSQLATQLQLNYGKRGFEERNIRRMMQFSTLFSDFQIVSQAATKLSWSHFIELLPLKEVLKRDFYLTMALNENWGRDTLRSKIEGMLFERSLIYRIRTAINFCLQYGNILDFLQNIIINLKRSVAYMQFDNNYIIIII